MQVVFCATDTLWGSLIRGLGRSEWNHVDILFEDGTLIGANTERGVEKMTLNDRLTGPYGVTKYRIDEIHLPFENAAREFAEQQIGKSYDYLAVLAFLMPWRGNWNARKKWFCSELVAAAALKGGTSLARIEQWGVSVEFLNQNPLLKTIFGPYDVPEPRP